MLARQTICFSVFLVLGDMLINDGILALRQHCNVGTSVYGWMLQGHTYKTVNAELPHLCVFVCHKDDRCQSFNFVMPHQRCEFNNRTSKAKPGDFISSPDRLYFTRGISRGNFNLVFSCWHGQHKARMVSVICHFLQALYSLFMYIVPWPVAPLEAQKIWIKIVNHLAFFVFLYYPITCFVTKLPDNLD